jgi:hypothetical protein
MVYSVKVWRLLDVDANVGLVGIGVTRHGRAGR